MNQASEEKNRRRLKTRITQASRCKCVEQRSVKFNMFWKYAQQVVSLNALEANEIPCLFVSMTTEALFGEMIFSCNLISWLRI